MFRLDVCLLCERGELVEQTAAAPDADGLRGLAVGVAGYRRAVRAVIESVYGARLVPDRLEEFGWELLVADAHRVRGLAALAGKTDRIDARVLAVRWRRDLVAAIWLPDPSIRRERDEVPVRAHRQPGAVAELTGEVDHGAALVQQQRGEAVAQVVRPSGLEPCARTRAQTRAHASC
jgi:hypothetical protein